MDEQTQDAAPSSTEPAVSAGNPGIPAMESVPNAVLVAASDMTAQDSVTSAVGADISSHNVENSLAEKTFEQRVEERFMALEQALMRLPHSIHTILSRGSTTAEEFAHNVLAHMFGRDE